MIVLGIETSGRIGSMAICRDDDVLFSHTFPEGSRHARDVMPAVDRVLGGAGLGRNEVDAVAVSCGPGSFTGLRVGATCAKALAYALGWKLVGVPSLEVQVQNVPAPADSSDACRAACPVQDARRDHVYGTVFRWHNGRWQDTSGVLIRPPAELADLIPPGTLVFGTGVEAYPEVFGAGRFEVGDVALATGRAEVVARLGMRLLHEGHEDSPMDLVPQYYRPTQAEETLRRRAESD